ncbi:MAG TPA: RNase adapter RapZ [Candidatus Binatia bacterium]|nr:RNase adapter RapZ [Candidatus Binatia bacterium]
MALRRFVIVTGLSGAGKSQAMKSLEDVGFYCLDNLPPILLSGLLDLVRSSDSDRLAVALDVRSRGGFGDALEAIESVQRSGERPEILFLDARDDVLVRRYSETRRRHPYTDVGRLTAAIEAERAVLAPLRERATEIWDTSGLTLSELSARVAQTFTEGPDERRIQVAVIAFGYKYGIPLDADLVFDVRFLPNPNYVEALHDLTGLAEPVRAYLQAQPKTTEALDRLYGFLDYVMPLYGADGRSALTIAVGCTGGHHRSVYVASKIAEHFSGDGAYQVTTIYRDSER